MMLARGTKSLRSPAPSARSQPRPVAPAVFGKFFGAKAEEEDAPAPKTGFTLPALPAFELP